MFHFIYQMSDILLFILITGIAISISLIAVWIIESFVTAHFRYKENQAVGYVSATICLIFAVLAGFAALYVLTNFNQAGEVVREEADMALAIYQDTGWVEDPLRSDLRNDVKNYLRTVMERDWTLMANDQEVDIATALIINRMADKLHEYHHRPDPPFALQEISKEIISLRNARAERVRLQHSALGPDIWAVLLLGAFLTIAINYAFGMQFYLHLACVAAVALIVSSMIFLLVVLDHPFQGKYSIGTDAFENALKLISHQES